MKEMLGCSHASINTVIRNELLEAQMFAIDLMNLKNSGDSTGFLFHMTFLSRENMSPTS